MIAAFFKWFAISIIFFALCALVMYLASNTLNWWNAIFLGVLFSVANGIWAVSRYRSEPEP